MPPQSTEYVIGSLQVDRPSMTNLNVWSRPNACALSCATVQHRLLSRDCTGCAFANENDITLSSAAQFGASGATPRMSSPNPISLGNPATIAMWYVPVAGFSSVTSTLYGE